MLTQVQEEYRGIVSKLEATILSEEQASEEDTTLLKTTEEFLMRMLPEVSSMLRKKSYESYAAACFTRHTAKRHNSQLISTAGVDLTLKSKVNGHWTKRN